MVFGLLVIGAVLIVLTLFIARKAKPVNQSSVKIIYFTGAILAGLALLLSGSKLVFVVFGLLLIAGIVLRAQ